MKTISAQLLLLSGVFAVSCLAQAQTPSPSAPTGLQGKTVRFDDSSTATLVLQVRGEGVQIYTCVKDADWAWKLKAPDATLFDDQHHAIGKHFGGPTWRLEDGSEVQGKMVESKQRAGTIPWLILEARSTGGRGRLDQVNAVRRTETQGGVAPSGGCDAEHSGSEQRVPYSAIYSFYDTRP
ncbi:MAG: DUF3455 domain-containing protein [Terracidiphilus sp.]